MIKKKFSRTIGKIILTIFGDKAMHYCKYPLERSALKKCLKENRIKNKIQLQKTKKIAIFFIGTGKYIKFFPRYYLTLKKLFLPNTPKDFFVFTDQMNYPFLKDKKDIITVYTEHQKWPFSTMLRFKNINKKSKELKKYSHLMYIDADTYVNSLITEDEFFSHDKPLFGVKLYACVDGRIGNFEFNPRSLAAVNKEDDLSTYWVGTFWGGQTNDILKLLKELEKRTDIDFKNNVIAKWHDESHLNKYFIERKHLVHTLNPSYTYPENKPIPKPFKKRIVHILKNPDKVREFNYKK